MESRDSDPVLIPTLAPPDPNVRMMPVSSWRKVGLLPRTLRTRYLGKGMRTVMLGLFPPYYFLRNRYKFGFLVVSSSRGSI